MSEPEPDEILRQRVRRVAGDRDVHAIMLAVGPELDRLARRYNRYRYGVPLELAPPEQQRQETAGDS